MNVRKYSWVWVGNGLMAFVVFMLTIKPLVKKQDNGCKVVQPCEYIKSFAPRFAFLDSAYFRSPQPTGYQNEVFRCDDPGRTNLSAIAAVPGSGSNVKEGCISFKNSLEQAWSVNVSV